jgi:uncharacterized membrane protein
MTLSPTPASPRMRRFIMAVDRLVLVIAQHWLVLVIIFLGIFAGLPFVAPVLLHYGITGPADIIYQAYGLTCHQLAYRTYFFFGEKPAYTIAELQNVLNVTNPASDALYWREFLGNSQLGYKMAWCERDVAIYISMVLAFVLFGLIRTRVKPLDWRVYLLFVLPMAIDGTWQLFTSPLYILPFLPLHESTPELRAITGALFGFGSVWLIFPYVDQAMRDAYRDAKSQFDRARLREAQEKPGFSTGK